MIGVDAPHRSISVEVHLALITRHKLNRGVPAHAHMGEEGQDPMEVDAAGALGGAARRNVIPLSGCAVVRQWTHSRSFDSFWERVSPQPSTVSFWCFVMPCMVRRWRGGMAG